MKSGFDDFGEQTVEWHDRRSAISGRETSKRSRRSFLTIAAVVLVIAVASLVAWKATPNFVIGHGTRRGWNFYMDLTRGWSLEFPASWRAQDVSENQQGGPYDLEVDGILISNMDRRFEHPHDPQIGWTPWYDMRGLSPTLVAVQVMWSYGGGFGIGPCQEPDTPLPLSFATSRQESLREGEDRTQQQRLHLSFIARRDPYYSVTAWIGEKASASDRALLDKIVTSISFANAPPAPTGRGGPCV